MARNTERIWDKLGPVLTRMAQVQTWLLDLNRVLGPDSEWVNTCSSSLNDSAEGSECDITGWVITTHYSFRRMLDVNIIMDGDVSTRESNNTNNKCCVRNWPKAVLSLERNLIWSHVGASAVISQHGGVVGSNLTEPNLSFSLTQKEFSLLEDFVVWVCWRMKRNF